MMWTCRTGSPLAQHCDRSSCETPSTCPSPPDERVWPSFPRENDRTHPGSLPNGRCAEPDRPIADEVADHDVVGVALADGDPVDSDDLRARSADAAQLLAHVVLVELLDGAPIEVQLLGHVLDGAHPTASSHIERKALRVEGIVGEEVQLLALHGLRSSTRNPSHLELEIHAHLAVGQIAYSPLATVVPAEVDRSA